MSNKLSWVRSFLNHWTRKSDANIRRRDTRLWVEPLEVREVLSTITMGSGILTYTAGTGINNNISVSIVGSNFQFNDTAETITCSISGASGSGSNTVDVPTADGSVGVTLALGTGADAISSSGVVLAAQTLIINHSGTGLTISGPLATTTGNLTVSNSGSGDITDNGAITTSGTSATAGAISVSSTHSIFANANINAGGGPITLRANTSDSGTAGFSQSASGSTISTTSSSSTAVAITANSANGTSSTGGTGNVSVRSVSDAGTLKINAFGGSILYSGADNFSSAITSISEPDGSFTATVTPAGTTGAAGSNRLLRR